jgi:hypothetical protein
MILFKNKYENILYIIIIMFSCLICFFRCRTGTILVQSKKLKAISS